MKSHSGKFESYVEVGDPDLGMEADVIVHYDYDEPDPSVGMHEQIRINAVTLCNPGFPDDGDDLLGELTKEDDARLEEEAYKHLQDEAEKKQAMREDAAEARREMMREENHGC